MTALQAFKQAQETGQIKVTKQTANLLKALAAFEQATEELTMAIDENLPVEISDTDTRNKITDEFHAVYSPLREYIYKTMGEMVFKGVFVFQLRDDFKGL